MPLRQREEVQEMLRKLIQDYRPLKAAGAVLTGWMLACSFPLPPVLKGMEGAGAAWMALIPLMLVVRCSRPRAAFGWGWLGGMVCWLLSLSWLLSLRHTWNDAVLLPALGWMALSAYCAVFIGLFAFVFAAVPGGVAVTAAPDGHDGAGTITGRSGGMAARLLPVLAAPVLWAGTEVLRATLFTGFPWNPLGVSQYRNVPIIQLAKFGGVYAVSALVVLLNAALAMTILRICTEVWQRRPHRRRVHVELLAGLGVVALCWSWGVRVVRQAPPETGRLLRVAAVQPAVPQVQKWSEAHERDIYAALRGQTELALMSRPDLVVWPETATPGMLGVDPESSHLAESLAAEGCWLLAGSMDFIQPEGRKASYLNGSFLLSPSGAVEAVYHKRHLVIFGEYLPFESWFPFLERWAPLGFSCIPGAARQPLMRLVPAGVAGGESAAVPLSVLICFEDAFPYLARRDVRGGARLLINQTNDSWFDGSAASRQHMANAVLRTVENRVPLVRAANTGVTCFVDRFGRLVDLFMTPDGDTESRGFSVSAVTVSGPDMVLTPYTRYGDLLFGLPCALLTLLSVILSAMLPVWRRSRTGSRCAPEAD